MLIQVATSFLIVLAGFIYKAIRPPPPRICGSLDGPPVTSPRVKLGDGRHLAYKEAGVRKEEAKHKIIVIHGFDSSKDVMLPISQELIKELKIYVLFFDRAGYGESDPNPKRSVKSEALDIQELADVMHIGPKFYVVGLSIGAYAAWSCLKYIPQRLSGVSLVVPFVHYWWPCLPPRMSRIALRRLPARDRWAFRVAHYAPWLFYWWMTQKWFPSLSPLTGNLSIFSKQDMEILKDLSQSPSVGQEKIRQQGVHESLHRDLLVAYGNWEFDPLDLEIPNECSVHMWQGYEDKIIPFQLNRFISEKLHWIKYHEVPDGGHLMVYKHDICKSIIKALLPL